MIAGKESFQYVAIMIVCGFYLLLLAFYLNWRLKTCYKRTRSGRSECTVTFSEDRIFIDAGNMKSEADWTAVQSLREDNTTFMLYIAAAKFIAIPKRVCTGAQVDELRTLFVRQIKQQTRS
jgi:hypothetical protein